MDLKIKILLDSGAFSGFTRGVEISLFDYIDYCKRHDHELDGYVNLDCIPGKDGKTDYSREVIEFSAAKSYENLQIMRKAGLKPIAVFHQGERFYWLDKMVSEGIDYIGISPSPRSHQSEIIRWMDKCFTRCTDAKGRPLIKTHGFGVTACNLCVRYPWTSIDSTSWSVGGGYGSILVPQYAEGKPDYGKQPLTLNMSARKQHQPRGFDALTAIQQDVVRQAVLDAGLTMAELRNSFMGRWRFNVHFYLGMAAFCNGRLFKNRSSSFEAVDIPQNLKGFDPKPLTMYFATVIHTNHHNQFLNENCIQNRLLSYAFLKEMDDAFLGRYIETGLPDFKELRTKKMSKKMLVSEVYRVRRSNAVIDKLNRSVT